MLYFLLLHANELIQDVKWDEVKVLHGERHKFKERLWRVFIFTKIMTELLIRKMRSVIYGSETMWYYIGTMKNRINFNI